MRTPLGPLSILVIGTTLSLAASGSAGARHGWQERAGTNWFADPSVIRACGDALDCVDRGPDEGKLCSFPCSNGRDCDFGVCVLACRDDGFCSPHALCK